MAKASGRPSPCLTFQDQMTRKRDREFWHQQKWDNQVHYYTKWDKTNNKFEEWTSPRYYESNNQLIDKLKRDREKKDNLERRRAKLRKLLKEEDATYEIDLMVKKAKVAPPRSEKFDDIPTELLRDVNVGLKLAEDERRRHEAQINLYHQWRSSNPAIRDAERVKTTKNLKLSWLDQQVEKRMAKEKEEEECKRILRARDESIEQQKLQEQTLMKEAEQRNRQLQEDLLKQMEELKVRQELGDDLKRQECEEFEKQRKLCELQDDLKLEEARRKSKECALYNIRQYKLKLKQRARDVLENLRHEIELVKQIMESEAADRIHDELKRKEIKETMEQFLEFSVEQQQLEKRRQEYLDFIFDSEAKLMCEKQEYIWSQEQLARQNLINDVLSTIKDQVRNNISRNKDRQKEVLIEREKMLRNIEEYEREMAEIKQWEEEKRKVIRKEMDEQVKEKRAREKQLKALKKNKVDFELESIRQEEDRLKKEIFRIQNTHAPLRHARKKVWY